MSVKDSALKVAEIISLAGGRLVGRIRLQKTAFLLKTAGWNADFSFQYYHYGPYSEDLADASNAAKYFGLVDEDERATNDNVGMYSIYTLRSALDKCDSENEKYRQLASCASEANSTELELAATALFLYTEEDYSNPWEETRMRKPNKATEKKLYNAYILYVQMRGIAPSLPELPEYRIA